MAAPSFLVGGKVVTQVTTGTDVAEKLIIQPDGKYLLVGGSGPPGTPSFALVRYNADGTLDTSFSGDGKIVTGISVTSRIWDAALQSDNKIVVVGGANNFTGFDAFALARYNTDGTLDTSFGTGGIVTSDIGTSDDARAVAIQPDGKIVVAGISGAGLGSFEVAVVRYNPNGMLDTSFSGGVVRPAIGPTWDQPTSILIQPDGKILVGGYSGDSNSDFFLLRLNPDGTLDNSFSGDGILITPVGPGHDHVQAIMLSGGKILVAGYATINGQEQFALARYNTNGTLDTSFGTGGIVTTQIGTGRADGWSALVQPDGKILVGGFADSGSTMDFALVRYDGNGVLDPSFGGGDGIVTTDFAPDYGYGRSIAVQPDGKIVLGGYSGANLDNSFTIVRYNADGSLDTSFAGTNTVSPTAAYTEGAAPVVLSPDIVITDDGTTLVRATVRIAEGYFPGSGDVLDVDIGSIPGIAKSWNAATGTLTISGEATIAQYQQMLRTVTYVTTSDNPTDHGLYPYRTIEWQVSDGTAAPDPLFQNAITDDVGSGARASVLADINGDGNADLIYQVFNAGTVKVAFGDGTGSFGTPTPYALGGSGNALFVVTDIDGDGDRDVVTANSTAIATLLNDGTELLVAQPGTALGAGGGQGLAVGDFNRDGKIDAIVVRSSTAASLFLGNGDGTFDAPTALGTEAETAGTRVTAADFNNDGILDLAITAQASSQVRFLMGNGDGTFTVGSAQDVGTTPIDTVATDLDNDGDIDLVTANSSSVSVLLNNGGSFARTDLTGNSSVAVDDFDGDGKLDIVARSGSSTFVLLRGNGNGTFQPAVSYATPGSSNSFIAAGDLNGDGALDLVKTDQNATTAAIFLGSATNQSPVATTRLSITTSNDLATITGLPPSLDFIEDTPGNIDLSAATFADPDSFQLTLKFVVSSGKLSLEGGPAVSTVTLVNSPPSAFDTYFNTPSRLTYTPAANFNGAATLTVSADDGSGYVEVGIITLNVTPVNDPPTVTGLPPSLDFTEDTTADLNLPDIAFADPDTAMVDVFVSVDRGKLVLSSGTELASFGVNAAPADLASAFNGLRYKPEADFSGAATLTIHANDGSGLITIGTVTLNVAAANDPPTIATNAGLALNEGATATITAANLGATDIDNTAAQLTYTITTAVTNGTLFKNGTTPLGLGATFTQADIDANLITYTHDGGETTDDSFAFSVSDGATGTVAGSFAITVAPLNDPPTVDGLPASLNFTEDTAGNIDLSAATFIDPDATSITVQLSVSSGTILLNGMDFGPSVNLVGSPAMVNSLLDNPAYVRYQPAENASGAATLTVKVDDGSGFVQLGSIPINVAAENDPPVIDNLDGDAVTFVRGGGAVILDANGDSIVTDVDSPSFDGGTLTVAFINGTAEDNFYFPTNQPFEVGWHITLGGSEGYAEVEQNGAGGGPLVLSFHGPISAATAASALQTVFYKNTNTVDPSLTPRTVLFTLTDPDGGTATAEVTVNVEQGNTPPAVHNNNGLTLNEGATATITADLLDFDDAQQADTAIVYTITTAATNGTLFKDGTTALGLGATFTQDEINNNRITFAHNGSETTDASFGFSVGDGIEGTTGLTFAITVTPQDDAPVAVDDDAVIGEDSGANAIDVLDNDTDVDGGLKSIATVTQGSHGTVAITGGGTGLTYTPNANYAGEDTFTYTLNGGATATVTVTVSASDDPPIALDDSATVDEDSGANAIDVLGNDTDNDGGLKSIVTVTQGSHGTVAITGGGTGLTYTPHANYAGEDTFTYTLNGGATATVTVTVTAQDDPPVALDDMAAVSQDSGANTIDVLGNDTDADGGPKTIEAVTQGTHGAVSIAPGGGAVIYTPLPGHSGGDTFTYTLNGGATATVTVIVNAAAPVNSAPTDISLSNAVIGEASANGTAVGAFSAVDPDLGDTFTYTLTDDAGGRFAISGSNLVVANYILLDYEQSASHAISVHVVDSGGLSFDKTITVSIGDLNPEFIGATPVADFVFGGGNDDSINGAGGEDTILGGGGNDQLGGGSGNDTILGQGDDDTIWGEDGNDILAGNDGNDTIVGGDGDDIIGGDDGDDTLNGGDGDDTVFGGAGDDHVGGGDGNDIVVGGDGNDSVWGEGGDDIVNGGAGDDKLLGGDGNDQLGGGSGNDILQGDAGDDTVWGEEGDDLLVGGTGNDILVGGPGNDTFVFFAGDGNDIITDFVAGGTEDRIWFNGTDINSFADVLANASFDAGTHTTTISYGGTNAITLNGVALASLTAGDFLFS